MQTQVGKWGHSLAVRIPKSLAEKLGLGEGQPVALEAAEGALVLRPVPRPEYDLKSLAAGITPENRHEETDWGGPAGGEAW